MGVVFENNLLALLGVLLVCAVIAGVGVALWKPVGRRAWRYFVCWWQRDQTREREARAEIEARRRAEREVAVDCFGANAETATIAAPQSAPVTSPGESQPVCGDIAAAAQTPSEPLLPTLPTTPQAHLYSRN